MSKQAIQQVPDNHANGVTSGERPTLKKSMSTALVACSLVATCAAAGADEAICAPSKLATLPGNAVDKEGIQKVLDTYTQSVTSGDRARFESQLLDKSIPFFGIGGKLAPGFRPALRSVQDYAGFRQGIFDSGKRYTQKFYDVQMDQDGDLAQVSLKFKTLEQHADRGGCGWKILHLLRVDGDWKIASEFYTVYGFKATDW